MLFTKVSWANKHILRTSLSAYYSVFGNTLRRDGIDFGIQAKFYDV